MGLRRQGNRVTGVLVQQGDRTQVIDADHVISSMCLPDLMQRLDPAPPSDVLHAASQLKFRSLILVGLIVKQAELFPDQWLYIHSPELRVGRIQNVRNWSPAMVPDPATASLGMEYFCSEGDDFWRLPDGALIDLASRELEALHLVRPGDVVDGVVFRQPAAYPVYDEGYQHHVHTVRAFLETFTNLQTIGRNGMHRYNNQDHSMLTAQLAVRNWMGEVAVRPHDLWDVNTDLTYHEGRRR